MPLLLFCPSRRFSPHEFPRCSLRGENTKDMEEKCRLCLQRLDGYGMFVVNRVEVLFNSKHSPMGLSLSIQERDKPLRTGWRTRPK